MKNITFNSLAYTATFTVGMLLSSLALANEALTVYGKVNVSVQNDHTEISETNIKSNASRIGIKGGVEVNEKLKAIYKLEWQVDVADNEKDLFKARSQWVGLKGDFGSVMIGRNDTMLKLSQGKIDQFNDLNGDIKNIFNGENRLDDTITYFSPKFNGFVLGATFIAEDNSKSDGKNGSSFALMYGDKKLKKTNLYAAIAIDSDVAGRDTHRFSIQGKINNLKLGAIWNDSTKSDNSSQGDGFLVNAAYKMNNTTLKIQYADSSDKLSGNNISLGADFKLAKNVKLYGFYTDYSKDSSSDADYLGLGMEYKF